MNVGRMGTLDRERGFGSVVVVEGDQIYRIELGSNEVKALDPSLIVGAPIRLELSLAHDDVRFIVHPYVPAPAEPKGILRH